MRGRGPVVAVVAFLAFTGVLHAAPDPTLDRIIAKHVAARGGLEKIRSIETLRQKGRMIAGPGREALVTREISRPSRTRFEFTMQGVTAVFESDGKRGFKVDPFEGSMDPIPLSDDVVAEAAEQTDLEGPLADWRAKGHRAELLGRSVVGEREAYEIRLTLASGAERREFIDAKFPADPQQSDASRPRTTGRDHDDLRRLQEDEGASLSPPDRGRGRRKTSTAARGRGQDRGQPAHDRRALRVADDEGALSIDSASIWVQY